MRVHVLTRGRRNQELARGSARTPSATPTARRPSLWTARSCSLRPASSCRSRCAALDRGGTLAVAGIWLSDIPMLGYDDTLFQERPLRSVTANTRADGEEFLALAERFAIHPEVTTYPMVDAPRALADLAHGRFSGAAVLCAG